MKFKLKSLYKPSGDQPQAISNLLNNFKKGHKEQIILGATGTGKTFTIANIINKLNKKTLIIAHNKTLAGQLFNELKEMFPDNKVEYFISYYDYYQPEAYIISRDIYIEKEKSINEEIVKLRQKAINSLINNDDVIVVSSVSCIFGVGDIEDYKNSILFLKKNQFYPMTKLFKKLIEIQYKRDDFNLKSGIFRVHGNILDLVNSTFQREAIRLIFVDDKIEEIKIFNILDGLIIKELEEVIIFPSTIYATNRLKLKESIKRINEELKERINYFKSRNQFLEAQKIEMKTRYDIEMLSELGYCNGIENYSRHLSLKEKDEPPTTLIDYFGSDFLIIIDESHLTVPQIKGMFLGDKERKKKLIEYGFRLPSALDNRPLKFNEFNQKKDKIIYLSATPGPYELGKKIPIVEQIIRPTFILEPQIEVRSSKNKMEDLYFEIKKRQEKKERVLVTTLTIDFCEELSSYLKELGIKTTFLHSKINSLSRLQILRDLRMNVYDCLIGVNLLREGLDLPEVSLIIILDADKTGFLRNESSLIQIIGRSARHVEGKVIMYADKITLSMKRAISETNRRRIIQEQYNKKYNIQPKSISKKIDFNNFNKQNKKNSSFYKIDLSKNITKKSLTKFKKLMKEAAQKLDFDKAIFYRDLIHKFNNNKK
ncbi:MAG: excinuclease ABC subunit UvrB [Candidatus Phytoplasma stylosanthis]|uniref:excinuclease ABC subunit UvrB n=1 Tax=Candidatus Phytoplasma stylosanthis TaxID=2798314 RepID=UPI00293A6900|nr:excinuclease ABC subunit UvrB [Candidatus Phytoplasma stylosanthis]MDV3168028.1 excinuclease ABC subunit UvrB [Candidatus Phytoplasma stylosanthis]MDV3170792.1 excinuclease ABC subunit UvrB [Candidatus Phytoplasma stylosanthis]MDV3173645.1 excinuclease ABC subunit UvrB [Candidatus Phytoplasma stylosanthis]MDV3174194.1 excinuclease ABC subunit UvrB [Candidatus Phytoplasma stylosanthis]MDV3202515.1 excinuclease ABC subunit UvrB [Candidatus Phytoplasma stylosanthis]